MTIDDLSMDSDHSDISLAMEELLAEDPHYQIDRVGNVRRRRNQIRHRIGLPFDNRHRRFRRSSESSGGFSDGGLTNRSLESGSTGSVGSLRDFVSDETMGVDNTGANFDYTSDMPTSTPESDSEHSSDHDEPSSPPFRPSSNTNPIDISRRNFRGRRVALSSPEPIDSDSVSIASTRQSGPHDEEYSMPGGFSPLQSSPAGGRSQDVPIHIDSDSDAPPIRPAGRRRKRTTALSISSDEETSVTRGVDIPRSSSSRTSDRTARIGARISTASNSPSIVMSSSSAPPTSSSRFPSPRPSARHRGLASMTPSEDASVERDDPRNPPSISSRNTSATPSGVRGPRAALAHTRDRSERRGLQAGSLSNAQQRNRNRLKQQFRARQRQERPFREDWNRPNSRQQLAYIGGQ